jgi:hypothetical protein
MIIADTGVFVALLNSQDNYLAAAVEIVDYH